MTEIIKQTAHRLPLPDFRNLGVVLRILLFANALGAAIALGMSDDPPSFMRTWMRIAAALEPLLFLHLAVLYIVSPWLQRIPYRQGIALLLGMSLLLSLAMFEVQNRLWWNSGGTRFHYVLCTLLSTAVILAYFNLRARALSPALTEARLQALQARIRPHFLFNSINAVLSLVRSEPKRAEMALEDMADLFRVLMADNRELVLLKDEVSLCQQYLDLEKLRLGDRLQVEWHIEKMPENALIPPMVLQPLLENAVYHGIEPSMEPGVIDINIFLRRGEVHMVLRNPYQHRGSHHAGNKMALNNIRERLALHFDAEASLESKVSRNMYQVHIVIPYRALRS